MPMTSSTHSPENGLAMNAPEHAEAKAESFYARVLPAGELREAMSVEGLAEDIAALRALLRERMNANPPEKLADVIRCFSALVRAVGVAHGLREKEREEMQQHTFAAMEEFVRGLTAQFEPEDDHV